MKTKFVLTLATIMFLGVFFGTGCRSSRRTVTLWPGDRNVTVVKKPSKRKYKMRKRAVRTRKYNRASR